MFSFADWVIQIIGALAALGGALGVGIVCVHYSLLVWYKGETNRYEARSSAYDSKIKMLQSQKEYATLRAQPEFISKAYSGGEVIRT